MKCLDNVNSVIMEQDDPCILSIIRSDYLHAPSNEKLNLESPDEKNPSMGQAQSVLEILKNKVKLHDIPKLSIKSKQI